MTDRSTSVETLQRWLVEANLEIARLREEANELQTRLMAAEEKADLLGRLIGLESAPVSTPSGAVGREPDGDAEMANASAGSRELEPAVETLIREERAPLHISDIRERLVKRGVPLPGRGDEANIIVRLRRATDKFVRTGRGTYGLVELGHQEVLPTRARLVSRQRGL